MFRRIQYHFIIASPRSGTTWLQQALNTHQNVFATESRLFGEFCENWPNGDGTFAPRVIFDAYVKSLVMPFQFDACGMSRSEFLESYFAKYFEFWATYCSEVSGKKLIVDKITPYVGTSEIVVAAIAKYFPDAKVIELVRDGRDVVTSGVFDWVKRESADSVRHQIYVQGDKKLRLPRFFDDDVLSNWSRQWREPGVAVMKFDRERVLSISYEQLQSDFKQTMSILLGFLGLPKSGAILEECKSNSSFEQMHKRAAGMEEPLNKARKGVMGDWRKFFTQQDAAVFNSLAGDRLVHYGYVDDDQWIGRCPVELNTTNDHG